DQLEGVAVVGLGVGALLDDLQLRPALGVEFDDGGKVAVQRRRLYGGGGDGALDTHAVPGRRQGGGGGGVVAVVFEVGVRAEPVVRPLRLELGAGGEHVQVVGAAAAGGGRDADPFAGAPPVG